MIIYYVISNTIEICAKYKSNILDYTLTALFTMKSYRTLYVYLSVYQRSCRTECTFCARLQSQLLVGLFVCLLWAVDNIPCFLFDDFDDFLFYSLREQFSLRHIGAATKRTSWRRLAVLSAMPKCLWNFWLKGLPLEFRVTLLILDSRRLAALSAIALFSVTALTSNSSSLRLCSGLCQ